MAKCSKGCMPECEYFTTGGCVSPFNCPYKVETSYINSATSTPDNLTDLLIEFDEMGFAPTTPCPNPEEYAIAWREKVRKEIARLESENAALRERLENAVELPCKVGDTVYQHDQNGNIYESEIKNIIYDTNSIAFDESAIGESIFLTREAVEARIAELKGETK